MSQVIIDLKKCFFGLPKPDLLRLKFHVEKGTPICCGLNAHLYTNDEGGG